MAKKTLTEEEMNRLRESPYVLNVSPRFVNFSVEFKRKFWNSITGGKEPDEAVSELGIDPEILGKHRINGLRIMLQKDFRSGKSFSDIEACTSINSSNLETKVKYLQQQLAYKDQEIEFLKKIVSLGREEADT